MAAPTSTSTETIDSVASPRRIPIFLLKTPSTPTDAYHAHFSSLAVPQPHPLPPLRFEPRFVPVLENRFLDPGIDRLRQLLLSGAFHPSPPSTVPAFNNGPNASASQDDPNATSASLSSITTAREPASTPPASSLAGTSPRYGGMILTSQRASEALIAILSSLPTSPPGSHPIIPATLPIYTVGPATTRVLLSPRFSSSASSPSPSQSSSPPLISPSQLHGSHTGNGENLANFILTHHLHPKAPLPPNLDSEPSPPPPPPRLPLLFPVGREHRPVIHDTLTAAGVGVDELVVYETLPMPGFEGKLVAALDGLTMRRQGEEQRVDTHRDERGHEEQEEREGEEEAWVLLFSPTGSDAVVSALGLDADRSSSAAPPPTAPPPTTTSAAAAVAAPPAASASSSAATRPGTESAESKRKKPDKPRRKVRLATIGPTTRDHLREKFRVEVDVCAEKPTPEGIAAGIVAFLDERRAVLAAARR